MADELGPKLELQSATIVQRANDIEKDCHHHRASEYLTPRNRSPEAGHDEEFEWVRLPRKREFEVVAVPGTGCGDRGTAHVPLTAIAKDTQTKVVMWAKMDTGADANLIHLSTLHKLLGDETESSMRLMRGNDFNLIGSKTFRATHYVELDFWTGRSRKRFEKIPFVVVQDDPNLSNKDGVPNVILGWPTLHKESMLVVDFEYILEADPELRVIATRSEEEFKGMHTLGPLIMLPTTKGFARPPKR